ncbi:MAG: YchJ family protein [Thiohalocapsa sp.]|nr:YchJ family protein [Thiohalocapsa sp.]
MPRSSPCPCGGSRAFDDCCGPIIAGEREAETAEALMRSRYTAYALRELDYLRDSWHPASRPAALDGAADAKWIGLDILACRDGGRKDAEGIVEFVARFKIGGRARRLHEISRFARVDGRWYYVDGEPGPTDTDHRAAADDA